MYETLERKLKELGVGERQLRYAWRLLKETLKDYILYHNRHRGVTVLRIEYCKKLREIREVSEKVTELLKIQEEIEMAEMFSLYRFGTCDGSSCSD